MQNCPSCGSDLEEIGCEKTVICDHCKIEWQYDYNELGMLLKEVDDNSIYWDR